MRNFFKFFSKIANFLSWFLWVVPFLFFFLGYYVLGLFSPVSTVKVPALVGKNITQGLEMLAQQRLNARMIACKEDLSVPEGTILTQHPNCGDSMRIQQTVFITSSKKPEKKVLEDLRGFSEDICKEKIIDADLLYQKQPLFSLNSSDQACESGECIAFALHKKQVVVYTGKKNKIYIVPDCKNFSVQEVRDSFGLYQIPVQVQHTGSVEQGHTCYNCHVTEQKPLAGSSITLDQDQKTPIVLQVKVEN